MDAKSLRRTEWFHVLYVQYTQITVDVTQLCATRWCARECVCQVQSIWHLWQQLTKRMFCSCAYWNLGLCAYLCVLCKYFHLIKIKSQLNTDLSCFGRSIHSHIILTVKYASSHFIEEPLNSFLFEECAGSIAFLVILAQHPVCLGVLPNTFPK